MSKPEYDITSEQVVDYILSTNSTIRQTATHFGCSKTLIWARIKRYNGDDKDKIDELFTKNMINSKKNLKNFKG